MSLLTETTVPFFPFSTSAMGGFGLVENGALSFNGRFDLHQAIDTFSFAAPVVTNTAYLFAVIKIHFDNPLLLFLFKKFFADTAIGAEPVVRQIFKCRSRGHAAVGIAYRWIVYVTAGRANPFTHNNVSFPIAD
jgi:hypothetical protein